MSCDHLNQSLSEGVPLTERARNHLESCASCRAMIAALELEDVPDRARIAQIQALLGASLKPVRPLPRNRTLISIATALFVTFSIVLAIPVGFNGFHVLSTEQRFAYYSVIALCAILFSGVTAQEMIPGSKRYMNPGWVVAIALLSLIVLAIALFPNLSLDRFVRLGAPCLRLGCICALISGALSWFLVRKGFLVSPINAGATIGFFAGLTGVAVLALHCPIQNSAHIIVWHLGAMILGSAGGAIAGFFGPRVLKTI